MLRTMKARSKFQETVDTQAKSSYVDAGVQTDPVIFENPLAEPVQLSLPPLMPMGSMQDFFRDQYSLGDALMYV